jgi:caa(3)-type oxidase subunit IV
VSNIVVTPPAKDYLVSTRKSSRRREWHTVVGLTFAVCKAVLVALFFMHLLSSSRLTWIVVGGGLFWLGILMALTLADYLTRHWLAY